MQNCTFLRLSDCRYFNETSPSHLLHKDLDIQFFFQLSLCLKNNLLQIEYFVGFVVAHICVKQLFTIQIDLRLRFNLSFIIQQWRKRVDHHLRHLRSLLRWKTELHLHLGSIRLFSYHYYSIIIIYLPITYKH